MATNDDSIKKNISKNITKCREGAGLSQKELALLLNITPSRVSNWEQGSNCPTIDMLLELCKILDVSINDIYGVYPDSNMQLAYEEMKHIEKYRILDGHGKEMVDFTLLKEWERVKADEEAAKLSLHIVREEPGYLLPNAAHTDESVIPTPEMIQEEEDIMDDKNF